ncbi:D-beta-hydroxybutyrate dehydrogenase-like isoform X2 [Ostrea edulis]|uniref:D-beta-hydroxybutyrate dehydrogenase-like isoform X2 n=1 Tax=Ostrea edulis TaxID=37623 RepID=UPI0020965966|nr:D-beta-hydroxybutyrate dehydrogenase-like isoform X2 [Ostrea edulis]XP_048745381.1 D-beta-hydroxybutyrate dehydrogenase-like isoform X2 [Ostrea edulis]
MLRYCYGFKITRKRQGRLAGYSEHASRFKAVGKVHYIQCDLRESNNVLNLCNQADQLFPEGIDILVNNAGIQHVAPVDEMPLEKWNELIHVNLTVPFMLSKHVIPSMKKKGWGKIVNVSSVMAMMAHYNKAPYISSKTGLVGLTRAVAMDTAAFGITCNAICPAWTDTPLVAPQVKMHAEKTKKSIEEAKKDLFTNATPTRKINDPSQIAGMVLFLCSPDADNMTGTAVPMDGAMTVQ